MRTVFAALALLSASPAVGQVDPYKLVLYAYQSSITVVDYPSSARCQAAVRVIQEQEERARAAAAADSRRIGGGAIISAGPMPQAYCIPG